MTKLLTWKKFSALDALNVHLSIESKSNTQVFSLSWLRRRKRSVCRWMCFFPSFVLHVWICVRFKRLAVNSDVPKVLDNWKSGAQIGSNGGQHCTHQEQIVLLEKMPTITLITSCVTEVGCLRLVFTFSGVAPGVQRAKLIIRVCASHCSLCSSSRGRPQASWTRDSSESHCVVGRVLRIHTKCFLILKMNPGNISLIIAAHRVNRTCCQASGHLKHLWH